MRVQTFRGTSKHLQTVKQVSDIYEDQGEHNYYIASCVMSQKDLRMREHDSLLPTTTVASSSAVVSFGLL